MASFYCSELINHLQTLQRSHMIKSGNLEKLLGQDRMIIHGGGWTVRALSKDTRFIRVNAKLISKVLEANSKWLTNRGISKNYANYLLRQNESHSVIRYKFATVLNMLLPPHLFGETGAFPFPTLKNLSVESYPLLDS